MKRITLISLLLISVYIPAYAQGMHIVGDGYFGCISKDYFNGLVSYVVDKDMEAFKTGLAAGILTKQCVLFKSGETVFIIDTSIFSGLVQIRRKGTITEYWTNMEAVK